MTITAGTEPPEAPEQSEAERREAVPAELTGAPVGRRLVLGLLGLGAAGVVTGRAIQDWLARRLSSLQQNDPTGLSDLLPLGNNFRYYSIVGSVPVKDASNYELKISGLVDNPVTLTLPQLRAMMQTDLTLDFQCVTGWRVLDVPWRGVKLADLLDAAGVKTEGRAVRFTCFDDAYTESLTLQQARRDDVIVALEMLGEPVTHDHGGPVRLYVGPMYGYKSAKWLSGIEITGEVKRGYWEGRGYDIDAWVGESNGRNDVPTS
ncbi:MAG: Oxidoreductase molybdopterin binding [Jatrophihabitantaceae bacterium]|nr:Oxidoreductase molybdopterin binding [Jatrophihabitantaceae bacterium]